MLKVVAISDADPQNTPQAAAIRGLQPIPLCLRQRPRLTIVTIIKQLSKLTYYSKMTSKQNDKSK